MKEVLGEEFVEYLIKPAIGLPGSENDSILFPAEGSAARPVPTQVQAQGHNMVPLPAPRALGEPTILPPPSTLPRPTLTPPQVPGVSLPAIKSETEGNLLASLPPFLEPRAHSSMGRPYPYPSSQSLTPINGSSSTQAPPAPMSDVSRRISQQFRRPRPGRNSEETRTGVKRKAEEDIEVIDLTGE
ncbi:uncharacterized protein K452DRAFT_252942 [Aplosporella prunicola CBS 121167]|uniref:Uncharacterized protein n=1 Tax=Aplosporella prunicola CBS 121167 TaxID=1176127 RepID=A0A6A6B8I0_9PEZI|nr:uncharacterized protein K452DRAFT_252942 [Aplosporella prunicola CBS 121167]KAF2140236.1 hypothetical protein K452DRAFT_252942 [Aplosporella prunicola CBS 121167]